MSVTEYVDELLQVKQNIKENNATNKALRERVHELEDLVREHLVQTGKPSFLYKGKTLVKVVQKETRPPLPKHEKDLAVIGLLRQLGVSDPHHAFNKLTDVQKGETKQTNQLSMKKRK